MRSDPWQAPGWYRALTLIERTASLAASPPPGAARSGGAALGHPPIERWRRRSGLGSDDAFARRLAADGLSEEILSRVLQEPVAAGRARARAPAWLAECAAAFSGGAATGPVPLGERQRDHPVAALLPALHPLIARGCDRLRRAIRARVPGSSDALDISRLEELFVPELAARLLPMLSQTAVLELHVAGVRGKLSGASPDARWHHFVRRMSRRGAMVALLQEYPVLARQIATAVDDWVRVRTEFAVRLCRDRALLRETFSRAEDPGPLVRLVENGGDTHQGGDSVVVAELASGLRLVYKPRSLAVDAHFQELLAWLNERGDHPPLPVSRVLDRGAYGWVEYAAAAPCRSIDEVRRFYRRSGGYLALLHALSATDLHADNVVAAGEHPVLVDLEAMFHPELSRAAGVDDPLSRALEESVLRVGLLPERRWPSAESDGVDLSGLNGAAGQLSPIPVRTLEGAGTDNLRFVRRRVPLPGSKNRPVLDGAVVDVAAHADEVVAGFEAVYRALLAHRDELLAAGGPLDRFAGDEVRVILRDTYTYARLLQESFHPDALRDALDRDCLLDQLWRRAEGDALSPAVIAAERADLARGDLPRFVTLAGSRDLSTGPDKRLPDFFAVTGIELARRRLRQLGEEDLTRQRWFVRASLAALVSDAEEEDDAAPASRLQLERDPPLASTTADADDRARLIAAARAIGDRLAALAVVGRDRVSWLGLTLSPRREAVLAPLGLDLYDGVPGVALFLAFLGAVTGECSYTGLARAAMVGVRSDLAGGGPRSIGAFTGHGGLLHVSTQLGLLWGAPELLADAHAIADQLPGRIERDDELDVLGGAAGCIAVLLGLHRRTGSGRALEVAARCGEHLIARATRMPSGIGWLTGGRPRALTGFSHGAAGMAWALLQLAASSGAGRFRSAAIDALRYERSQFAPEAGNWPDLRRTAAAARAEEAGQRAFLTAWCHGAAGIGLARLHALPLLDDEVTRHEIDVALSTTRARGFGRNHCLCHGDLGNLELLVAAGERLGDGRWSTLARERARSIVEMAAATGWRSGAPLAVESPGLMTGLAGIGYGLLRLASPAQVPSVLTLDPVEPSAPRAATEESP